MSGWIYFYRYAAQVDPAATMVATGDGTYEITEPIRNAHDLALLKARIKDSIVKGGPEVFGESGPHFLGARIQIDALTILGTPNDADDDTEERQRRAVLDAARNVAQSWAAARPSERTLIGDQLGLGVLASDLDDLVRVVGDSR